MPYPCAVITARSAAIFSLSNEVNALSVPMAIAAFQTQMMSPAFHFSSCIHSNHRQLSVTMHAWPAVLLVE
jgi:hypothetical protein